MKKAIVIYNSRGGNTKKIAEKIAEGLESECVNQKKIPDLQPYDLIVLGTWMVMGRISFKGSRYLKKLHKKNINGKKVALFGTSGAPNEIHPSTKETTPKTMKEILFESMEERITRKSQVSIHSEKFCSMGATRIFKKGKPMDPKGHPSEEELENAKQFGISLKS